METTAAITQAILDTLEARALAGEDVYSDCVSAGVQITENEESELWKHARIASIIGKHYGHDFVGEYAKAVKRRKRTIYERRQVYDFYPESARRALLEDTALVYSHLRAAMRLGLKLGPSREEALKSATGFLDEVIANDWTVDGAQVEADRRARTAHLQEPSPLPDDVFNVIYADPPWEYQNSGLNGAAQQHYPTLSTETLCALPDTIFLRCADDAVLLLWATSPLLADAIAIIEAWDFNYKACMVWVKDRATYGKLGTYLRTRHELLLIATRGSFPPAEMPDSVIEAPRQAHSQKPDVYALIESMYPRQRYLELFARHVENARPNWTYWGNQIDLPPGSPTRSALRVPEANRATS